MKETKDLKAKVSELKDGLELIQRMSEKVEKLKTKLDDLKGKSPGNLGLPDRSRLYSK